MAAIIFRKPFFFEYIRIFQILPGVRRRRHGTRRRDDSGGYPKAVGLYRRGF